MRKILSIAILTFRDSMRAKLVAALAAVVAVAVIGLPMLLKADGTPVGVARMTLLYPLGAAFAFLALAAPWTAAASLASDVKGRTLQLVRVKPVRMWQLWCGKWLGLLFLNAALLLAAFLVVYTRLAATGALAAEDIAIAKRHIQPVLPPLEKQIAEMEANIAASYKNGMTPKERRELRATLRHRLPYANASLRSGDTWHWFFVPERLPKEGETVWFRLGLHSDALSQKQPKARILFRTEGSGNGSALPDELTDFTSREVEFSLPAPVANGTNRLELAITNTGEKDAPQLLVQPRKGLFLLLRAGRIEANMLRAYAVLLSLLALLLAIGLTAGAFFTLPVAVFTTTCAIIAIIASAYAVSDPDILDSESFATLPVVQRVEFHLSAIVTRTLAAASAPALSPAPLTHLSMSKWVPEEELLHAIAVNAIILPAILAFLSSLHLARKELPE
jgi:ABC-type transport system involved in multi-copper enzyme maturation permease subunit